MSDTITITNSTPIVVTVANVGGHTVEIANPVVTLVEVATQGPQGIQGPAGAAGALGSDLRYTHIQSIPLATWVVTHNLAKKAVVTVVDSTNTVVYGGIAYNSDNQMTLSFSGAFSGYAYFN